VTWSLLVTVTVAPGSTVTVAGEKAKLWMVIESELAAPPLDDVLVAALEEVGDEALPPPVEHAARATAIPTRITATIGLIRPKCLWTGDRVPAVARLSSLIGECSMPVGGWMTDISSTDVLRPQARKPLCALGWPTSADRNGEPYEIIRRASLLRRQLDDR
jgi:hypothetical protein